MTASGVCAWKVVFRWFTWMAAMLDANPSIGAAVATVKKGLPSLKLKYRVTVSYTHLPYVINMERPFNHYRYRMHQEDLAKQFGRFYKEQQGGGKTVCLLGMRASESLQRYSAFLNKKYGYKGECWISKQFKDVWCASPLYDWTNSDVWVANARFGYDYNRLYDLYYQAGLKIDQMRVASPFNDYSKDALNLYRVIDPEIWTKLVGRVRGANFGAIYSLSLIHI